MWETEPRGGTRRYPFSLAFFLSPCPSGAFVPSSTKPPRSVSGPSLLRRELRHGGRIRSCPTPRRPPWSPAAFWTLSVFFSPGVPQAPGVVSPFTQTDRFDKHMVDFTSGIDRGAPGRTSEPPRAGFLHAGLAPLGPGLEAARPLIGRVREHPSGQGGRRRPLDRGRNREGCFQSEGGRGAKFGSKTC